jgi:hypothetical protein
MPRAALPRFVLISLAAALALGTLFMAVGGFASTATAAQVCAARQVTVSGRSAASPVVARRIAQTNWQSRVARTRALGPRFAQWGAARDKRTVCRKLDDRAICLAVARPCRSGGTLAKR